MAILVTGGAGYIGSHTCVELLNQGCDVIVLDNFMNSHPEALNRVKEITGKSLKFYHADLLDKKAVLDVFSENHIEAVIHFAGLKAVGESVSVPLQYYRTNMVSTMNLCETMQQFGVKKLVFSSSATVYGTPEKVPITEDMRLEATNPYGRTKLLIEEMLRDIAFSDPAWSIALLRYFNPIGAHSSGLIGEDPSGIPNNLMPYISQVATGKRKVLQVFGNDYPTKDGTGVRDYIHVVDLAIGHLKALEKVQETVGIDAYNLGTGKGYSVLEVIQVFEKVTDATIPYQITERRPGDISTCYADPMKASLKLGWKAEKQLEEMCRDTWKWQSNNPDGYRSHNQISKDITPVQQAAGFFNG
ncbi:UDP-glucose 4-epimerase GalE [Oceanobacillus piezotolerans]|uniref:UDP-glucose 4-epimerase n=1 Tax=Oceanobacillus piezotolerans TaxID=2448030 RepID=A0A498D5S9_9BACI|nr:UDP-glucose 4-epimerase GalE [Oceanobacillus piezotolerans]RLL42760.1 UDP-glucose 4-epimerase GalE [Oceanobacillus piezotolerans]